MRRWVATVLVLLFSVSLHGAAKVPYGIDKRSMPRGDPSYYKTAKFMSWSRGGYFFYADASSPAALDRFMKAFPF